ncbi:MAG: hypothetical protein II036_04670 [Oscillospiraceae bacterium]|nr:hypothetical protein [Oscillospiraceae bacterium]
MPAKAGKKLLSALFWLIVWQGLSLLVNNKIVIVGPYETALALFRLIPTGEFWAEVGASTLRITVGFLSGAAAGITLAALAYRSKTARELFAPLVGATPRYFERIDGSVNEEEFADLSKSIVHVSGNLGEDSLRQIGFVPMSGVYVSVLNSAINELRETSGNTETATGTVHSGVTAASAIAALQEASGKGSRDCTRASYLAFAEIVELCIELIRQFYTLPRQFRITGPLGGEEFVSFSNAALVPQDLGSLGGVELGQRLPVFDIRVEAQKRSAYSRLSQNELAMELYRMGFFAPGNEDTAAACLAMMDFDGRGELMRSLARSSETRRRLEEGEGYRALALALMRRYRPDMAAGLGLPPEGADLPPLAEEEEAAP